MFVATAMLLPAVSVVTATSAAAAPSACSATAATIGSVQGAGDISPAAGQTRTVRGTVVGDYEGPQPALRGFYLQDAGDGDPATSDAVFVFDNGTNLVANGDVVEVTGAVSEFQGQTQISAPTGGVTSCGATATVAPVDVTLPRVTPADLEPYEGMLVRLHQTATVTESFQLGRFGQVVVSSGGKLRQPTSDIRATDRAAVTALQNANNLNRLIVDDADQAQNPDPIAFGRGGQPLSGTNTLRGGDTVTDAVGVLTYTWAGNAASGNAYRLRPIGALGGTATFDAADPRPTAPPAVGEGGIKVASANLLNFFNTFTGCTFGVGGAAADCRGPNNDAEYQRQLAKEVDSLTFLGADVIGYMEMENDGYGPGSAIRALVDALNAKAGAGTWAFVDPDAATGVTNSAGTDAIKPGLLYKPASVTPVAGATFADQAAGVFERNPVGQTFTTPAGAKLTVIANHFKSKGSCPTSGPDTDQGDGQSCWNARRTAQATELARWITDTVVPGAGDPDVMIVGDLNSYAGEDPIAVLEGASYVSMIKAFGGDRPYSYVFDGQWGYLDYVMASASLIPQVTGAGDAHHNADEPSVIDYNTEFKTPGQVASLYAPDRFRTSDHDPVLAGLALAAPAVSTTTLTGTTPVAAGAPVTFTATVTGPTAPTGTVTFTAGTTTLGAAPVGPDGTAVLTVAAPAAGSVAVVASYSGSPQVKPSTSAPFTVEVQDPVRLAATVPDGTVGQAYSVPVGSGTAATFTVTTGALPPGLVLAAGGTLSGTLTTAGRYTFTVTGRNAVSTATGNYTLTVAPGATTLTLTSSRNPSPTLGAVTFTATLGGARPGPGGTVTFRAGPVPLGPPVPVANGSASRSTALLPPGTTTVTATYSGSADYTGSTGSVAQTVLLPALFAGTPPAGTAGKAYRFTFIGTPGATYSVVAGSLPAGLTLSPAGVLSGTPTARGTSAFTVRVANAISKQDRAFTVRVR